MSEKETEKEIPEPEAYDSPIKAKLDRTTLSRHELKHRAYLAMCKAASLVSTCPRNKFGAILVNRDGRLVGHGYNGTVAQFSNMCGGDDCLRDRYEIKSGTRPDVGCLHAEQNLVLNSSRQDLDGGTVYVNGEPCLMCAKFLAQAKVELVVVIDGGYSTHDGLDYLGEHEIDVTVIPPEEVEMKWLERFTNWKNKPWDGKAR